jgi:hypothetical protein
MNFLNHYTTMKRIIKNVSLWALLFLISGNAFTQNTFINSEGGIKKISATYGGFSGKLNAGDLFSVGVAIGDVNGDGIEDMAVGAQGDDDGTIDAGAVWILFLNEDRTVKSHQKISATQGGFTGILKSDRFGRAITSIGDMNNDGVPDIAVSAYADSDGGTESGAVYILFLKRDGTVKSHQKISATQGGLVGLTENMQFGSGLCSLGDLDGDGIIDLAVGTPNYYDDGSLNCGAVWILFLKANGTVKKQQRISSTEGGLFHRLNSHDYFGTTVANIGDVNGDGIVDIAVEARGDDDETNDAGAIYIIFLNNDGTVKDRQKISALHGGFNERIRTADWFGFHSTGLGDIDGDSIPDIATSVLFSDKFGIDRGLVYILNLNRDGTVKKHEAITSIKNHLDDQDCFGYHLSTFKSLNENGKKELIVGSLRDDDGAEDAGAVYIIELDAIIDTTATDTTTTLPDIKKISAIHGGFTGELNAEDFFCRAVAIGDIDGDGIEDLAVGAHGDSDGYSESGAVWILFMNENRTVRAHQKISSLHGGFSGNIRGNRFGSSIAAIGDMNNDGVPDIVVSAYYDSDGGSGSGAVFILFLNQDGTVKSHQKISATQGGLIGLTENRLFGSGLCSLGDLDGDGVTDIAVGAPNYDNDGGLYCGSVWILFLNANGTVKKQQIISQTKGNFKYTLVDNARFGTSLANIGDINGDGIPDISVSARGDNDGGSEAGANFILFLNKNGTVKESQKISALHGNFKGEIKAADWFGFHSAGLGDIDGDGIPDMALSAPRSDLFGKDFGVVYILNLNRDGTVKKHEPITLVNQHLDNDDWFGVSLSTFSGLNKQGKKELIIGSFQDDDGSTNAGAVYFIDIDVVADTTALPDIRKISAIYGGFTGELNAEDFFCRAVAIGDIDGDGIEDLAVGAHGDSDGYSESGAVWILFMNENRTVRAHQKISSLHGGFSGNIRGNRFGSSIAAIGDMNNDGVPDIVVSAYYDSDGGSGSGAVFILFLNQNGTVKSHQKISATQGGLVGLTQNRLFGSGLCSLGDLDGDGVTDIAVGAPNYDNDGGLYCGSVWILFLNANGTVKKQQIISQTKGNFKYTLVNNARFGTSLANIGDINGDGIPDISVSARGDNDGGSEAGANFILFLNKNGTVKESQKISALHGDFKGEIKAADWFGFHSAGLGDIDGDGIPDMALSAPRSDLFGKNLGVVYILNLNRNGTVKKHEPITLVNQHLDNDDWFGVSLSTFSGLNKQGKKELIIGSFQDDDGSNNAGAVYFVDIDIVADTTALPDIRKISAIHGGFTGELNAEDFFCRAVAIGDIDGDGIEDLAVGAHGDSDGYSESGAVWILFMNENRTVRAHQKISSLHGGFSGNIRGNRFGSSIAAIGDMNNDGVPDIVVSAYYDSDGGSGSGAVFILFLNQNGTVKSHQKISATQGGLVGLTQNRLFGSGLCSLGDLDGDGVTDIAVGAPNYDNDGGLYCGSVWILFLNANGTVKKQQIISQTKGNFKYTLVDNARFGTSLANIGDINGDGIPDISASARGDNDGGSEAGANFILFLNKNGTVKESQKISALHGNFKGEIKAADWFGFHSAGLGDIDGDGIPDMALSAPRSDLFGKDFGVVYILNLNRNGTVKKHEPITLVNQHLDNDDWFGVSLSTFSGLNKQGKKELIIGSFQDDDGSNNAGAVYFVDIDIVAQTKPIAVAKGSQIVCSGSILLLDGSMSTGAMPESPLSYDWSSPSIGVTGQNFPETSFISPNVEQTTLMPFVLRVNNGILTSDPDTLWTTINPAPQAPSVLQVGDTLKTDAASGYQWFLDGKELNGATNSELIISKSGFYQVKVTNNLGCVSSVSDQFNAIRSSVEGLNYTLKAYPNPTAESVFVTGMPSNEKSTISVYDIAGKLYLQMTTEGESAKINLSQMPSGAYIMVIKNQKIQSIKITKE